MSGADAFAAVADRPDLFAECDTALQESGLRA